MLQTGKDRHWKGINGKKNWRRPRHKLGCRAEEREFSVFPCSLAKLCSVKYCDLFRL
jgi:hypothetical protein